MMQRVLDKFMVHRVLDELRPIDWLAVVIMIYALMILASICVPDIWRLAQGR